MSQNNFNHYSDLAKFTKFDPANTDWDKEILDVQSALSLIGRWARTDVGLPISSESTLGIIRIATQDEVDAGIVPDAVVTAATLKATVTKPVATTDTFGITRYATDPEAVALTARDRTVTAGALGHVFKTVKAKEDVDGTIRLTSQSQAQSGTDETTAVTPKRVVEMIGKFTVAPPSYSAATETNLGLVRVATSAQVAQGQVHDGFAVTPKTFINTKATEGSYGVTRLANDGEAQGLTANNIAISPKSLATIKSSPSRFGLTRLAQGPTGDGTLAAAATNTVFTSRRINGKTLDNDIYIGAGDVNAYTRQESDDRYMSRWARTGNITRVETHPGAGPGEWWGPNAPGEGNSRVSISLTAKFGKNNDGYDNRYFTFRILVNGAEWQTQTINIENTKGGKSGHKWQFEGYGTGYYQLDNIPAGAQVTIAPVGNNKCMHYTTQMIFCTY